MHALIIEDDAVIAMLIEEELRDLGYSSVDVASTEEEAVRSFARRPDLVTSDGSLLHGSGVGAVGRIRALSPVRVIFITGDPEDAGDSFRDAPILAKPFSVSQLIAAVQKAQ